MHDMLAPYECPTEEEYISMSEAKVVVLSKSSENSPDDLQQEKEELSNRHKECAQRILKSSKYLAKDPESQELISFAFSNDKIQEHQETLDSVVHVSDKVTVFVEGMKIHHMKQLVSLADRLTLIQDVLTSRTKDTPTEYLIALHKEYRQLFESLYEHFTKDNKEGTSLGEIIQNNTQINVTNNGGVTHPALKQINDDSDNRRASLQKINQLLEVFVKNNNKKGALNEHTSQ